MTTFAVQWYALRCLTGQDRAALEQARAAVGGKYGENSYNYEVWSPLRTYARKTKSAGWQAVEAPVLPGYLFCRIPADPSLWAVITDCRAILGFLSVEAEDVETGDVYERPAAIPNREVEYLMACEMAGDFDGFAKWEDNQRRKDQRRKEAKKWRRGFEGLAALNTTEAA